MQYMIKLQKIVTKVGATNEQTNENKVQHKNKTKFLNKNKTNKASNYYIILIIIIY